MTTAKFSVAISYLKFSITDISNVNSSMITLNLVAETCSYHFILEFKTDFRSQQFEIQWNVSLNLARVESTVCDSINLTEFDFFSRQ